MDSGGGGGELSYIGPSEPKHNPVYKTNYFFFHIVSSLFKQFYSL